MSKGYFLKERGSWRCDPCRRWVEETPERHNATQTHLKLAAAHEARHNTCPACGARLTDTHLDSKRHRLGLRRLR